MKCQLIELRRHATAMLVFSFLACVLCTSAIAGITRTWKVHSSCSDNVATLTSGANTVLQTKDRADDLAVCVAIVKGATDTGWTFTGDASSDGKVLSSAEETAFDTAAAAAGKNSFRLVRWNVTGEWTGFSASYGLAIMNGGAGDTLAHEVGHFVGLSHNTESKEHRIMHPTAPDTTTVNSTEKAAYEAKN